MDLIHLISADDDRDFRLQAALHGIALDEAGRPKGRPANRSHSHLERMKARRGGGH